MLRGEGGSKSRRKGRALTWDRFAIQFPWKCCRSSPDVRAEFGGLEQMPPRMRERALEEEMNRRTTQCLNKNLHRRLICGTTRSGARGRADHAVSLDARRTVDAASRAS